MCCDDSYLLFKWCVKNNEWGFYKSNAYSGGGGGPMSMSQHTLGWLDQVSHLQAAVWRGMEVEQVDIHVLSAETPSPSKHIST
jgi:hypothetical protein